MPGDILIIKKVRQEDLAREIAFLFGKLGVEGQIGDKRNVFIKPNVFCPEPSSTGATVDLELLGGVIDYFVERGKQVVVGEAGAHQYDHEKLFQEMGLYELCAGHDAHFINLNTAESRGMRFTIKEREHTFQVPVPVLDAEYMVNLPKYKTHSVTRVSLAMKNLYGLLPDKEKWRGHALGLNETLIELNRTVRSHVVITDAMVAMEGFGPTLGVPVQRDLLMASNSAVAHDFAICHLEGIKGALHIERAVNTSPPQVTYEFYDTEGDPIPREEIDLSLKLMPRRFTLFWYKLNEKFYAAAPVLERGFISPKKVLRALLNRRMIDFIRFFQGGRTSGREKVSQAKSKRVSRP